MVCFRRLRSWCDEATLIELIFFNSYRTIVYWSRYMVTVATAKADEMFQLTCCTYFPRFFSTFIPHRSSCIVVVRQHRWNISLHSSEKLRNMLSMKFWNSECGKESAKKFAIFGVKNILTSFTTGVKRLYTTHFHPLFKQCGCVATRISSAHKVIKNFFFTTRSL